MQSGSPLLPWEVIERVIGHSGDHPETLFSFSLTCPQLRPRTLCFMVTDAKFQNRDQIFSFCDFVQAKPHLKPLVRSITVHPVDFAPFPLLYILPNLSEIAFISRLHSGSHHSVQDSDPTNDGDSDVDRDGDPVGDGNSSEDRNSPEDGSVGVGDAFSQDRDFLEVNNGHRSHFLRPDVDIVLNQSTLTCCQRFGTHIQALHLSKLFFSTYLDFSRVLLMFTDLTDLVCSGVFIRAEGNQAHLDRLKPRLSERLHLRTIDIDYVAPGENDLGDKTSVVALLLDSGLVQSTVETLTVQFTADNSLKSYELSHGFDWPRLRSLVLKLKSTASDIATAIMLLKDLSPSTLKDVAVEWHNGINIGEITNLKNLVGETSSGRLEALEQALLRFPQPRMVWLPYQLHKSSISFWTQELGKHFPVLFERGAFTVTPMIVVPGIGHDGMVLNLATSPDSKWVATGSSDGTVILWDVVSGAIVQQWVPHNYGVKSLAFSPDSRRLVSGGYDTKVKIWDLAEGLRRTSMKW